MSITQVRTRNSASGHPCDAHDRSAVGVTHSSSTVNPSHSVLSDFPGGGGVGLIAMDELVFCLPEKKWVSIYVHLVLPEASLLPGYPAQLRYTNIRVYEPAP